MINLRCIFQVQAQLYVKDPGIPLFTSLWRAIYLRVAFAAGHLARVGIYESAVIVPWRAWGREVMQSSSFLNLCQRSRVGWAAWPAVGVSLKAVDVGCYIMLYSASACP